MAYSPQRSVGVVQPVFYSVKRLMVSDKPNVMTCYLDHLQRATRLPYSPKQCPALTSPLRLLLEVSC
jgi:hypothetical protein